MNFFAALGPGAWITIVVVLGLIGALVSDVARPDLVMLSGLSVLLVTGIVTPEQAFQGFSNSAVLTVGALYIVAGGVHRTNALSMLDRVLFPDSASLSMLLARFMVPTSLLSGMLNNTPIVAMLTPRLQNWADEQDVPASKLMIPLSYAAITGGMMTLVGTSTNLIVAGLMEAEGYEPLHLFDITWIGVPAAGLVIAYFVLGGHRLLPDRGSSKPVVETELDQDTFEVKVTAQSPIIGQTVADAGLRDLGDAYLTHVRRGTQVMQATPRLVLEEGDLLAFNGSLGARERLLKRPGLNRTLPQPDGIHPVRYETLPLYEAVIAESSDLVGSTLRETNFRETYQGVVLGIQREDQPMTSPVGTTELQAGDLLIVEAPSDFEERWSSGSRDEFYLVAPRDGRAQHDRDAAETESESDAEERSVHAPLALFFTGAMILTAALDLVSIVTAAFIAALLMILSGCITPAEAQRALNVQVLIVIAAALGIGQALETTGLAQAVANGMLDATEEGGPVAALAALYLTTNLLTEIITNNAAAVLMLPISMATASTLGAPPTAFGLIVAVAASASFLTPIGYQTNLMVMAPGGYKFSDYARAGWPVTLLVMGTSVTIIALLWL